MRRIQSIICASLLTLVLSSAALAGDITGRKGDITGKPGDITGKPGDITGKPGDITGKPGDITGLTDATYDAVLAVLSVVLG